MAQINITLNQEEILQLMKGDREGAFAMLLQNSLNVILKTESTEQLHAENYERTDERAGYRNGSRERSLNTRIGTITLQVPKHREGQPFKTMISSFFSTKPFAVNANLTPFLYHVSVFIYFEMM
jgi:transposase-like protein